MHHGSRPVPRERCIVERLKFENEIGHLRCVQAVNIVDDAGGRYAEVGQEARQQSSRAAPQPGGGGWPQIIIKRLELLSTLRRKWWSAINLQQPLA